jgi:serine/threonine protein kinase
MSDPTTPGSGNNPDNQMDSEHARRLLGAALNTTPNASPGADAGPTLEEVAAIFPQLEIIALIGRGGMGSVYKARQRSLDRLVALKILHERFSRDPQFMERFTREARALARLNHPNIVSLHDFGEVNGRLYLLMEFVDGPNLREVIQSRAMKPAEALAVVPKLCDALQYAHEEGIIHRDIKPENVLMDKRGRVKIADFGLAKMLGDTAPGYTLTGTGTIMGTPHYMAPEQLEAPQTVDHRADVYALGVVFYEMLTGELPLGRFQPPSRKVQIDVRLDEVVLRAMDREPALRYQHASEVRSDVEAITSSKFESAPSPSAAPSAIPPKMNASPVSGSESESLSQSISNVNSNSPLRLEMLALTACALTFTGPLLALGVARLSLFGGAPGAVGFSFVMMLPILVFPLIGIFLGFAAARNIRDARGQKTGLGLAIFTILAVPTLIAFFASCPLWRFVYAVGIAMDNATFWHAIGNPVYSLADKNREVYWSLAGATALLFMWLSARALSRAYSPGRDQHPGAANIPPAPARAGRGPMPLWYLLLIIAAVGTALVFGLLLAASPFTQIRKATSSRITRANPTTSQLPIAWRVLQDGTPLSTIGKSRHNWVDSDMSNHMSGATAEDTFQSTSGLVRLRVTFLRREGEFDFYNMHTFASGVDGSGGEIGTEIRYNGTLQRFETINGVEVHLAPKPVLDILDRQEKEPLYAHQCLQNLKTLNNAKAQYAVEHRLEDGKAVTMRDLIMPPGTSAPGQGYIKAELKCPSSGVYHVAPIGHPATCSVHNTDTPTTTTPETKNAGDITI